MLHNTFFDLAGKSLVSTGGNREIFRWESPFDQRGQRWQVPVAFRRTDLAPDGRHLATANADGTVSIFRLVPAPER